MPTSTFTGADGDPWPSEWSQDQSTSGSVADLDSNRGRISLSQVGGYTDRRSQLLNTTPVTLADGMLAGTFTPHNTTSEVFAQCLVRVSGASGASTNCYALSLNPSYNTVGMLKRVAGTQSAIATDTAFTFTAGTPVNWKIEPSGTTIRAKVWTGSEPGTWTFTVTDSSLTAGRMGVAMDGGSVAGVVQAGYFDDVWSPEALWLGAGSVAYSASLGTSVAPAYPANIAAGQLLVLIVGQKPSTANGGTVTTPSGWTLAGSLTGAGGYGTSVGGDTGNTNVFVYTKTAVGTESGTLSVTVGTNNICWAQIHNYHGMNNSWDVAMVTGSDTTSGNVSIAMSNPGVQKGDQVLVAMVIPTDVTTPSQFSAQAISQTGVTYGLVQEVVEPDTATGNQVAGFVIRALCDSGTATAGPTVTATAGGTTTNVRGPMAFIRIRSVNVGTIVSPNTVARTAAVVAPSTSAGVGVTVSPSTVGAAAQTGFAKTHDASRWRDVTLNGV